jgi:hypothetical protein
MGIGWRNWASAGGIAVGRAGRSLAGARARVAAALALAAVLAIGLVGSGAGPAAAQAGTAGRYCG